MEDEVVIRSHRTARLGLQLNDRVGKALYLYRQRTEAKGKPLDEAELAAIEAELLRDVKVKVPGRVYGTNTVTKKAVDLIEPCGFPVDDKRIRRAAMDYYDLATIVRHASWAAFQRDRKPGRLVLLTTTGAASFTGIEFRADDTLLFGRESAGVPAEVHAAADLRLRIPLQTGARSLNVALAAAMVLSEALRQTSGFDALAD